jgi:HEAT repeat protein
MRHPTDAVREAALHAMAEVGGKEVARPAVAALRDDSAAVRAAATRVIGVGGDPTATPPLVRRLEHEEDEGVLAGILLAIGRLGAPDALGVLAKYAEPGGFLKRRTPHLRAAAIEGIGHIHTTEARALLELYSHDKEPTVRRAAEAALQ